MIRAASVNTLNLARKNKDWDLKTVGTVHDENIYIVKEEYLDVACEEIKKAFEKVVKNFIVPVNADIGVGDNYSQAK